MLVDSHCHLDTINLEPYAGALETVLENAKANDVSHMLCVCINLQDFPNVLAVADRFENISASVGLHPNEQTDTEPTVEYLSELAEHSKIVAIGETGLDYYRSTGNLDWQRDRFRVHITAAKQCHKPLIIHSREADADTVTVMTEEKANDIGGVMHCFAGDVKMAQQCLDLGFYISFSGVITFKNAESLRDVVRYVPMDRILVETDSPYLAPVPYRGKPNQPAYVKHVAEQVAELKKLSYEQVAEITTNNFFKCFPLAAYIDNR